MAVTYAVRHPGRVSHLVLLGAFARGRNRRAATREERQLEARFEIVRLGWGRPDPTYRQIFVAQFLPEGTQEEWRVRRAPATLDVPGERVALRPSSPTSTSRTSPLGCRSRPSSRCARNEPDNAFEQSRELASLIPGGACFPWTAAITCCPAQPRLATLPRAVGVPRRGRAHRHGVDVEAAVTSAGDPDGAGPWCRPGGLTRRARRWPARSGRPPVTGWVAVRRSRHRW